MNSLEMAYLYKRGSSVTFNNCGCLKYTEPRPAVTLNPNVSSHHFLSVSQWVCENTNIKHVSSETCSQSAHITRITSAVSLSDNSLAAADIVCLTELIILRLMVVFLCIFDLRWVGWKVYAKKKMLPLIKWKFLQAQHNCSVSLTSGKMTWLPNHS